MDFEFCEKVSYPSDQVYRLIKDGLADLIPFIPNVRAVEELEREECRGGETHVINLWHGEPGAAPRVIQPFLKPEVQSWRDIALWKDEQQLVEWRFEAPALPDLYDCSGVNYVEAQPGDTCQVRITGKLTIHAERIIGGPSFVAKKLATTVEKWLLHLISPNLAELPKAVQAYLDEKR